MLRILLSLSVFPMASFAQEAADSVAPERAGAGIVVASEAANAAQALKADGQPVEAQNWMVAAANPLAVDAGARVLKHNGEALTQANIGNVLATRDLMSDLRAADPFRQGGGKGFTKADRSRFLEALDRELRAAQR